MSIIKTYKDVLSQQKDLDKWEYDEQLKEEKLKKYNTQKKFSEAEIAKGKLLGERIIDTISVMDQNSEDSSQRVELITQPFTALGLPLGVVAGILAVWKPGKKLFDQENKIYKEADQKMLQASRNYFKDNDYISKISELFSLHVNKTKLADSNLDEAAKKQISEIIKDYKSASRNASGKILKLAAVPVIGGLVGLIGTAVYAAHLTVQGSRIARYQSRKELNDPKNFVIYTPEQTAKAKELAKTLPDEKKESFFKDFNLFSYFKKLGKLIKDNKNYEKEKAQKVSKQENRLSPEELAEIAQTQKILNRAVKKINNKAEEYSENMETTANVLLNGSFLLGGVIGACLTKVSDYFKVTDKAVNGINNFAKHLPGKLNETVEAVLKTQKGRAVFAGVIGGTAANLLAMPVILKLQKNASRAGRFEAKQELKKDPGYFIDIDDKELEKINATVPKEKGYFSKLVDVIKVMPLSIKQSFDYEKYKNTELKENKKLLKALKQQDVTQEQLNEAKKLQKGIFNTFEKIDENSEKYSEEVEAGTDSAMTLLPIASYGVMMTPFIGIAVLIGKGKIGVHTVVKKVLGFLSRSSNFLKSKMFKNYTDNVADNFIELLNKEYGEHHYKHIPEFIKENKGIITNLLNKEPVSEEAIDKLCNSVNNYELRDELNDLLNNLKSKSFFNKYKDVIENYKNVIENIEPGFNYGEVDISELKNLLKNNINNINIMNIPIDIPGVNMSSVKKIIWSELKNESITAINKFIENSDEITLRNTIREFPVLEKLGIDKLSKQELFKIVKDAENICNNLSSKELSEVYGKVLNFVKENPDKALSLLLNDPGAITGIFMTPGVKKLMAAAGISWAAVNIAGLFMITAYLAEIQKRAGRIGVMNAIKELEQQFAQVPGTPGSNIQLDKTMQSNQNNIENQSISFKNLLHAENQQVFTDFIDSLNKQIA